MGSISREAASSILKGIRVVEFGGLAPGPFCGMMLSDFGADVIRVERPKKDQKQEVTGASFLSRGKRILCLDLKQPSSIPILHSIIKKSDVVIDPYRPGVLEKYQLGPKELCNMNELLIYARLTGYGQFGPLSRRAGHDINFLSISGALSTFRRHNQKPLAPVNYLADFAGGGLMCAFGVAMALYEREKSGKGQVIDAAMIDGVNYLSAFLHKFQNTPVWNSEAPGTNILDSGAPFYDTYECKDGKFVAVGAIEPVFYQQLLDGLQLSDGELEVVQNHMDPETWPKTRNIFTKAFSSKTHTEWTNVFESKDACVTPVLELSEIMQHPHNQERHLAVHSGSPNVEVSSAPRFSRTPGFGTSSAPYPDNQEQSIHLSPESILQELRYNPKEIEEIVMTSTVSNDFKSRL